MKNAKGQLSLQILIFGAIAVILLSGFLVWLDSFVKAVLRFSDRTLSATIAEAGVEYYRWHLAHDPDDFQDGTGGPGPYVHPYYDKLGNKIGDFTLEITPPETGSTVATIRSLGTVDVDPTIEKIIEVKMGVPSFAKFAVAANADIRFGEGTEVYGEIFSNGGIRFDGVAYNVVKSAQAEYNDPDHSGNNEFGVHTHVDPVDPQPPAAVPTRTDVFTVGREFPVPALDFDGLTADMAQLKSDAQANGHYFGDSGAEGYHMVLRTDDSFDLYRVDDLVDPPNGCVQVIGQQDWGMWSIESETLLGNYLFPPNKIIFVEDDVWVNGQINDAQLTIAAGRFPENSSTYADIIVNNDLLYTYYDGKDVVGLIAQGNISAGWISEDDLRIDAALIAQNERIGRFYYRPPSYNQNRCAPYHVRDTITLYGAIITNERYGFAYTDGTGYINRNIIYDGNLRYNPPPNFPLTDEAYEVISWEEVK